MARSMLGWPRPGGGRNPQRRRRSRVTGCLLWLIAFVILLIILSQLFGGFQKGTKAGLGPPTWHLSVAQYSSR